MPGTFLGAVYGDLVGSPYMIENTYNRYFDLGSGRRAYSGGRVRSFFPEATEVTHGAAAVVRWLTAYRDAPTAENLQRCLKAQYDAHPRGGWTEPTRLFLTGGMRTPSDTPDWAALTRVTPIASFVGDDLFGALDLAEACVRATCTDEDTVMVAKALTHASFMALHGSIQAEIFTTMEMQYGVFLSRTEDDIRARLRGEVEMPLTMLGRDIPGASRYVMPEHPSPVSAREVAEAALKAVTRSDSWEDAVRRAVSYGGPSNAVAGIAGAVSEALYGEVTPSVIGKLFTYVPMDVAHQMEGLQKGPSVSFTKGSSLFASMERDAVNIITTGPGSTTYVVPEDRKDIRAIITRAVPSPSIITPSEKEAFLGRFREGRHGTYPFGPRPEVRQLYVQDGERLVSPSSYIAPGMPPLQERKRHLREFLSLRAFCIDCQKELNREAGNPDAGQVHYGNAYHLWVGSRRIDFFMGDFLAGRISLNDRGLLKVDLGEYRDLSADARFENHREQAWASRPVFTIAESADPLGHLSDIRNDIRSRLLDEGIGDGLMYEPDSRYLGEDERRDRSPVSNIDHLERLEPGEDRGFAAEETPTHLEGTDLPVEGRRQSTRTVFSIGYGARTQEGFINSLHMAGIDTVIDVRPVPRSRFCPQFDSDVIYEALSHEGIRYIEGGEKLGGRTDDVSCKGPGGTVDWEAFSELPSFRDGIGAIGRMAMEGGRVAVVGAEGDPLSSHRLGLVSRALAEEGLDVKHILTNGEVVSQAELEGRLLEKYTRRNMIPSVTSGSYAKQLSEAYRAMNREYGYTPAKRSRKIRF